jgi:hypothetical protein
MLSLRKLIDVKQISDLASRKWMQIFFGSDIYLKLMWILWEDFSVGTIFIWFTRHVNFLLDS